MKNKTRNGIDPLVPMYRVFRRPGGRWQVRRKDAKWYLNNGLSYRSVEDAREAACADALFRATLMAEYAFALATAEPHEYGLMTRASIR